MSTKTINIDYPSISASTTSPNVLANAYIQEVIASKPLIAITLPITNLKREVVATAPIPNTIASKEYHVAVASDNSTSLLVNAQPAGHPAIPGLYKRVSDVSNIVSIPHILFVIGRNVLSTLSTVSTPRLEYLKNTTELMIPVSVSQKYLELTREQVLNAVTSLHKTINTGLKLSQYSSVSFDFLEVNKLTNTAAPTETSKLMDVSKFLLTHVVPTDDTLGEAVLDDDQTAWVDKNVFDLVESIGSLSKYFDLNSSSSYCIASYFNLDNDKDLIEYIVATSGRYTEVSKSTEDIVLLGSYSLVSLEKLREFLATYSTTSAIFNEVYLHRLSNVLVLSSAIHSKETAPLFLTETSLLEMLSKYIDIPASSLFEAYSAKYIDTEQTHTTESPIIEEKDAFVSNYFQDLTYVAPTQYVGTLTLI